MCFADNAATGRRCSGTRPKSHHRHARQSSSFTMQSFAVFIFSVIFLLLTGCGSGTAGGPAPVDRYQVSISSEVVSVDQAGAGVYRVTGLPGSVPVGTTISVTNMRNSTEVAVPVNSDGSFTADIAAQKNDKLSVVVKDANGAVSSPVYVYVGAFNIKNPYTQGIYWYVGQVHFHSTHSDGVNTPAEMEAAYHDAGYDFVVSTDHRGTSPYFINPDAGLTPNPDNASTGKDLLWISGSELGFGYGHMGAWGERAPTPMQSGFAGLQPMIDAVRANGGIAVINHPASGIPAYAWDWNTEVKKTNGYSMVEAFNKGNGREHEQTGVEHLATAVDLADEFRQVWWIGTDDCHDKSDPAQFNSYAVVVQTTSNPTTQKDLLASMDSGNLYIRQTADGPALDSVSLEGNTITVKMVDVASHYDVVWKKRGNEIVRTDLDVDTTASYTVNGDEGYVRAEIQRLSDGKKIYTQPMFIANNVNLVSSVAASGGTGVDKLIDKKASTYWESSVVPAWFIVDVGRVRQVNAIRIDWYQTDPRQFNYKVEASETGVFNGEQKEVVRTTYDNRSGKTLDFFDAKARYLKVTVVSQSVGSGDSVRIGEVLVFDSSPARTQLYLNNVSGLDTNSGLAGNPWKTFVYARDHVRPRDTLNFMVTGVPYAGGMEISSDIGGAHEFASIIFQGDPVNLTEMDATGSYCGISLGGNQYVEWRYFDVHSADEADICLWTSAVGTQVNYNKFRNSAKRGVLASGDFTLAYNLIYGNANDGALIQGNGTSARIYNNVFYNNGVAGLSISDSTAPNVTVMNNISSGNMIADFWRGSSGAVADAYNCVDGSYVGAWQQVNSIQSPPQFRNAAGGDFRLLSTSPCIDAGIDLNFNSDFSGNAPVDAPLVPNRGSAGSYSRNYMDIGAFEYVP